MKVQSKILLLLFLIAGTFVAGLIAFHVTERQKFQSIARERAELRDREFDGFLRERGDKLKVPVDEFTTWDDFVQAIRKGDNRWAETTMGDETLATYEINALWIYRPDQALFYSKNNRFTEALKELPITREAYGKLFARNRECHFFVLVPQGCMEIRGATVHPSNDHFRETTPQGALFVGRIWIDDELRRMTLFTGYSIRIVPVAAGARHAAFGAEDLGHISFTRELSGWDGNPVARILVENDSPIIRELNASSRVLFFWLIGFAVAPVLILSLCLGIWIRRPLRLISENLERKDPRGLVHLQGQPNEFGRLAELILRFRHTEEKLHQAEEELRHAQKLEAVGRLAGGVAHDFNNLLTAIIGYSDLLERRLAGDGQALEHAQLIHRAGNRAAELTRQLLAFSRKQLLQPKVLNLNSLVFEMEKLLNRVIGEHIRIQIEANSSDPRILADPTQLEQVILNLGVNARDAMPRGGVLTISTANWTLNEVAARRLGDGCVAGEYVALSVKDTGSGMNDETRQRIFEPFFTTKGPGKGTGLGLATVYGVVKQSGGGITVESVQGEGSLFTVYLRRTEEPVELPAEPAPRIVPVKRSESVLVVEDEEVVRSLVCTVLEDAGLAVLCASCPSEALKLVQEHRGPIQLLITDVVMPEMHGPELARLISEAQPRIKVLYISGYSENDISEQGVIDSHLDVLQKPFTRDVLVRKVYALLDEPMPEMSE